VVPFSINIYSAFYKSREHNDINAYNLAIADFMHSPVISSVDIRKARSQEGYLVRVTATDNFMVTRVKLSLLYSDGKWREETATRYRKSDVWIWRTESDQLSKISTIRAQAYDFPGHSTLVEWHPATREPFKILPAR